MSTNPPLKAVSALAEYQTHVDVGGRLLLIRVMMADKTTLQQAPMLAPDVSEHA